MEDEQSTSEGPVQKLGFWPHHHEPPPDAPPVQRLVVSLDAGLIHTHSLDPSLTALLAKYLDLLAARVPDQATLAAMLDALTQIKIDVKEIKVTQQEMDALLVRIDTTTTNIGNNVQVIADTDQKISDEIDAFLAATPAGTVMTDAQVAQLQGLADKLQASSDASDAQVVVLKAIAAKGQPAVPQAPPAPVIP